MSDANESKPAESMISIPGRKITVKLDDRRTVSLFRADDGSGFGLIGFGVVTLGLVVRAFM